MLHAALLIWNVCTVSSIQCLYVRMTQWEQCCTAKRLVIFTIALILYHSAWAFERYRHIPCTLSGAFEVSFSKLWTQNWQLTVHYATSQLYTMAYVQFYVFPRASPSGEHKTALRVQITLQIQSGKCCALGEFLTEKEPNSKRKVPCPRWVVVSNASTVCMHC